MAELFTPGTLDLEVQGSSLAYRVVFLDKELYATLSLFTQGPVVRTPVSANLGFNPGSFFLLSKALSGIIFSILFRVSNHQIVDKENLTEFAF